MSESSQHEREQKDSRKRYALIKLVFGLFPLFVLAGFLTPGWVELIAMAQEGTEIERELILDRVGPYGRRPLLVPRDFSQGFIPELLDLDMLFLGSRGGVEPGDSVARVTSFDRSFGDVIAFDDLGVLDPTIEFKDILMDKDLAILAEEDLAWATPLCGTLYAGNCVRDDDFAGGGVISTAPVPEPASGILVGLGLIGLAWQGRKKS